MTFDPLIPASLWMALAACGLALLSWYGWRRAGVVSRRRWAAVLGLMSAALALVLLVLLNPTWLRELPPPAGKPLLNVLVDVSGSMATPDANGAVRYRAASQVASELAERLGQEGRFEVRVRTFS